jgi:acyl-CoA synthetase (AMP-forming)/AMP-acid ligase II
MTSAASERTGLDAATTIPRVVREAAASFADAPAVSDGHTLLSFRALAAALERGARALIGLEVAHGDRVAIWAPNLWEWIVAALAAHAVGAAIVPVNTRFKGAEAAHVLRRAQARTLFTVRGFLDTDYPALLRDAGEALPSLRNTVLMRGDATHGALSWEAFLAAGESIDPAQARTRAAAVEPGDLSDVIFTSGTTGYAKGVLCTHAQTLRAFRAWTSIVGLRSGDRYLCVNPFFHTFGYKAGWLASLLAGATIYPHPVFDAGAVLARVAAERISVLPGPPSLYQSILARADLADHDLGSLRLAVTGAAVIPVELVHRMRAELRLETVLTGYGLTEATGVSTLCRPEDDAETIAGTSGRAIPDVEVRVADETGRERPRGQPGEVLIRGYSVTAGYLDDAAATAEAIDAEGWLHTGDIGTMDARGYLRITDRLKDMFIVGGFNAYPAEIERVLLTHPAVAQVAVVGAPDERLGEVGVAFVVARPDVTMVTDELIDWSRERLANFKVPRRIVMLDALPQNATGKVLKYRLRELLSPK